MISRSLGCLITQTYISSHPASGIILIDPPISNEDIRGYLPGNLDEFTYEPRFPIAVIAGHNAQAKLLQEKNRICQSASVDLMVVEGLKLGKVAHEIELWLDQLGI